MGINHKIGERIAAYLVERPYDAGDLQCAKVCYGVESALGNIQKELLIGAIALLTGYFRAFLFCFLTVNLVRRFFGGLHMKTDLGCTMASVFVYATAITAGTLAVFPRMVFAGIVLCTGFGMAVFAPLPSPGRPRYGAKRKKKIRARGFTGLGIVCACGLIDPYGANYIAWTLILQLAEAGIVLMNSCKKEEMQES